MTLREQIKAIHAKHFNREFHDYRQNLIPAMVNDLKMKFFDDLILHDLSTPKYGGEAYRDWSLPDSVDIRAVKRASELIEGADLRADSPAVE